MTSDERGHVVLVGAGHANLLLVRRARLLTSAGLDVTLVDPGAFWYPALASAVAGGVVHPGRHRVDPGPLAAANGVALHRQRAVGLDLDSRTVTLEDGTTLRATTVVLNVGSESDTVGLPADRDDVVLVKPIHQLLALRDRLAAGPSQQRVTVVGGGASAVEVACNLAVGPLAARVAPIVTMVAPGPVVPVVGQDVRTYIEGVLAARGVRRVDGRVVAVDDGGVVLGDGTVEPTDVTVLATGLRAHRTVRELGLGDAAGMPVTEQLHHPEHPWLFGAGDCVRVGDRGLPRLGVFAVRQLPVLRHNLLATHAGRPLRRYEPDMRFISALDLGDGEALMMRGDRWFAGRAALLAKRALDEWFLRRHRVPLAASGRGWGSALG